MICEHLRELEAALLAEGFRETYRGRPWSRNCREWVYFDAYLPPEKVRARVALAPCVQDHSHRGTHDGQEAGFVCTEHWDAIIGVHELNAASTRSFG